MTDPEAGTYRVVIFARPDDPSELRERLQAELSWNRVDAALAARHAPGVLPAELPAEVAEQLAATVNGLGLRAVAVPASSLPDFGKALQVHHLRCSEQGLEICGLDGKVEQTWPWGELRLISVGRVPLARLRHYITDTYLHATPVPADHYLAGGAMHGYEGWLLFDPPQRLVRIDSEHLNYEYLGAEKTGSGTTNFERLIAELALRAPQAFLPPATRNYLTRGPILEYDFESSDALQEYTLTELCLNRELQPPPG